MAWNAAGNVYANIRRLGAAAENYTKAARLVLDITKRFDLDMKFFVGSVFASRNRFGSVTNDKKRYLELT